MNQSETGGQRKTVFISYSRIDGAFADKLRSVLIAHGFEAYLDKEDILPGEPWRARIDGLILAADAVVFVMSPSSIASEICGWEVRRALELKKSLTPLYWCIVPNHIVPEGLSERNYVFFDAYERSNMTDEVAFELSLAKLETALHVTDNLWVREHTKWVARAVEWDQAEPTRPEGKLLRSGEITSVQAWAGRRHEKAQIPEVVFQFVDASLKKEERDREELNNRDQRISQRTQNLIATEARLLREALQRSSAMRLALAAEPSEGERSRGILQDPTRHAELAAAAQVTLNVASLSGHSGPITWVAFSPDGARLVTGSDDRTARVWDARIGSELVRQSHGDAVKCGAFSPDGTSLATASRNTARVWDATSGVELLHLVSEDRINSASFSPDGARLMTAGGSIARVWDATSGAELCRVLHKDRINSASFSPDGARLMTAGGSTVRVWDATSGAELCRLMHKDTVNRAAFSPDGARLVTGSDDHTARVWRLMGGAELRRLIHTDCVTSAVFSPDGEMVLTQSYFDTKMLSFQFDPETGGRSLPWARDTYRVSEPETGVQLAPLPGQNTARVWDSTSGAELCRLTHDDSVCGTAFSPEGARVLTASRDRTARLWDAMTGVELVRMAHDGPVEIAVLSPDGARVVTVAYGGTAQVWDTISGTEHGRLKLDSAVNCAVFSPDGKSIVTGARSANPAGRDTTVQLWDASSGAEIFSHIDHAPSKAVESASFSLDGTRLLTVCDGNAHVWDLITATKPLQLANVHGSASFSRDGKYVVTASGNTACVWKATTGTELVQMVHSSPVESAVFDAEGARVVTASSNISQVWDVVYGTELVRMAHDRDVNSAVFSPDGARLVTGSDDHTARIWDASTGTEIARITHDSAVMSATYSPNGARVVTASGNTAQVRDAISGIEICRFTHRDRVNTAEFSPEGAQVITACEDRTARVWDVTWAAKLIGDGLVRAVARTRLIGEGRLTTKELRVLLPFLGDIDPDVVSRWLQPSPDDAEIKDILAQWRQHGAMSLALAREDWATRAAEIKTGHQVLTSPSNRSWFARHLGQLFSN